jgi:hypothetical protein
MQPFDCTKVVSSTFVHTKIAGSSSFAQRPIAARLLARKQPAPRSSRPRGIHHARPRQGRRQQFRLHEGPRQQCRLREVGGCRSGGTAGVQTYGVNIKYAPPGKPTA